MRIENSSAITEINYDQKQSLLEIHFRKGTVYVYNNVPIKIFQEFSKAQSKGQYFLQNIYNTFEFSRLA